MTEPREECVRPASAIFEEVRMRSDFMFDERQILRQEFAEALLIEAIKTLNILEPPSKDRQ